jgi:Putative rRNA methylase
MFSKFPLFQSHLDLAHNYWQSCVTPGDIVIDATCGNGRDTLFLCKLALSSGDGHAYAMDIQSMAIEKTRKLLSENLEANLLNRIILTQGCHSQFPTEICESSVKLIVYNLGYLPGGEKSLTTFSPTTLKSLESAQTLLKKGGIISLTCYPGHPAGKIEEEHLLAYVSGLEPKAWSSCHHRWINRREAPSLIILQKSA